jgi:hypothetical protein
MLKKKINVNGFLTNFMMFVKLIKTFKNETKVQWILSTTSSA